MSLSPVDHRTQFLLRANDYTIVCFRIQKLKAYERSCTFLKIKYPIREREKRGFQLVLYNIIYIFIRDRLIGNIWTIYRISRNRANVWAQYYIYHQSRNQWR